MVMRSLDGVLVLAQFLEHRQLTPGILCLILSECCCFSSTCSPHILKCVLNYSSALEARFSLALFQRALCIFGALMWPFGSATKETMCPLAPPQNQHIFNSHLNYLNLKTVWGPNIET